MVTDFRISTGIFGNSRTWSRARSSSKLETSVAVTDANRHSALFGSHHNVFVVRDFLSRVYQFEAVAKKKGIEYHEELVRIEVLSDAAAWPIRKGDPVHRLFARANVGSNRASLLDEIHVVADSFKPPFGLEGVWISPSRRIQMYTDNAEHDHCAGWKTKAADACSRIRRNRSLAKCCSRGRGQRRVAAQRLGQQRPCHRPLVVVGAGDWPATVRFMKSFDLVQDFAFEFTVSSHFVKCPGH